MNERCKGCINNWCEVRKIHLNRIHFEQCNAGESVERIDKLYAKMAEQRAARAGEIKIILATDEKHSRKPPRWLKYMRWFRTAGDRGVGDTVQRLAAKVGGERFKKFAKKAGIPCGCASRQARWNKLFPYS